MQTKTYSFLLTSSVTDINLVTPIENVTKGKVKMISYTTGSANNIHLMILINGFNTNIFQFGSNEIRYFKMLELPASSGSPVYWEPATASPDVILSEQKRTNKLSIQVMINGSITSDITPSNPLLIELTFE